MKTAYSSKDILSLADECISLQEQERPELRWLKEKYHSFRLKNNIKKKSDADQLIFQKMYSKKPEKNSDILKIRYWRTGQHMPLNRKECIAFGHALSFGEKDMLFLIQNYFDKSYTIYENSSSYQRSDYQQKCRFMNELIKKYLRQTTVERLSFLNISPNMLERNLRHIYYTDAITYIHPSNIKSNLSVLARHITSRNYDSEMQRLLRLQGEIPRKTMIRHLILIGMPHLTLAELNKQLKVFNYLPLTEQHTLVGGEHYDWLLIRLFQMYEEMRRHFDLTTCWSWFRKSSQILDKYFLEKKQPKLRFMYFKSLN